MKNLIYLLLFTAVMTACGGKNRNQKDDSNALMQDSTDARGLQRMQTSKSETSIQFKGKEYRARIVRIPDESLPHVLSEMGDTYVDNHIVLTLRCGNEQLLDKTFTKTSFASLVDEQFLQKSILEGLVYNKTTPQGIVFSASICYPQTDLYIPVSLIVSSNGNVSMEREEELEETYEPDSL